MEWIALPVAISMANLASHPPTFNLLVSRPARNHIPSSLPCCELCPLTHSPLAHSSPALPSPPQHVRIESFVPDAIGGSPAPCWLLEDLGAANGTHLNGQSFVAGVAGGAEEGGGAGHGRKRTRCTRLSLGDVLCLGTVRGRTCSDAVYKVTSLPL